MAKKEFSLAPNTGKDLYIVQFPYLTTIQKDTAYSFYGLLAKVIDDTTGLNEFVENPWIEHDEITGSGVYTAYVYLDKNHTDGIYDTFKFRVVED